MVFKINFKDSEQNKTRKHFNRPLSLRDANANCYTTVKWFMRAKVWMCTERKHTVSAKPIVISLANVETVCNYAYFKYEETPSKLNLRNYLIMRLPRKIGLRTAEIRTLTIEAIDFESRMFLVLDSKKHSHYPLPIDLLTLHFIRELVYPRRTGYVFIREGQTWKTVKKDVALTNMQIWNVVRRLAEECGIYGFNPRSLRRAFAYEWYKRIQDKHSKKTWKGLQAMMRHYDISITQGYVDKMFSPEDLREEFEDSGCQKTEKELIEK